jgi:hypothetical protein
MALRSPDALLRYERENLAVKLIQIN